jgi:hypothetical protein
VSEASVDGLDDVPSPHATTIDKEKIARKEAA